LSRRTIRFADFRKAMFWLGTGTVIAYAVAKEPREQLGLLQASSKLGMALQSDRSSGTVNDQMLTILQDLDQAPTFSDTQQNDLKTLIGELKSSFEGTLSDDHQADQNQWDGQVLKVNQCRTDTKKRFETGGDVHSLDILVTTHREKHKKCRKAENSWDDYVAAIATCPTTGPVFLNVLSEHAGIATSIATLQADVAAYESTAPVTSGSLPASCDVDQSQFESDFCTWRSSKRLACLADAQCDLMQVWLH